MLASVMHRHIFSGCSSSVFSSAWKSLTMNKQITNCASRHHATNSVLYPMYSRRHAGCSSVNRAFSPALSCSHRPFSSSRQMMTSDALALANSYSSRVWERIKGLIKSFKLIKYSRTDLQYAGMVMYGCCTDPLNHLHFFDVLGLPDTFNSWFKITELHVWMCAVRLSIEAYDGKYCRNEIVKNMWKDVEVRSKSLGEAASALRKQQIKILAEQFRANLFAYDEGLLYDDKVLAGALWRNFFAMQCEDPRKIELLVHYVRKQIDNLECQDRHTILANGIVKWIPINEVKSSDPKTSSF
ncbi:ubiquinol-cytochrome-c reductase complex assembly factor 1-like [Paramacrobiotus metropolitanus]|uniref:ubiquinol-cytochrome-c reductase complex assembly factor 1-like n=1 Tax=Paramacrobiotus metropolitanus TaxID=2943436 RepID=UPI00244635FC|nr:ubiquinol-cytochrome-c reductase complex assembly factor 1-like [Paramacrobiotus metropolitanus]